ncbi:23S rRNA pseudouridine(955/2504/2580) synthase RluC [Candidatus Palibaumannia cicadellinicola]|uniref:Pseudouridine synthase n=1 Tax=Candidatus Palibaumannia cicadellinicola TaxID=186490 RepID=A0A0K2BLA7_9GAMM|nr:23S rRNA pseudouridine(955/2504/2580) synthase RluC [Candidatus Baumannia cicadellinicola]AKZ65979.1 Ribosomal large subunit pseudouridine synthase C [Candidatus Baumannia cicadellinicola]
MVLPYRSKQAPNYQVNIINISTHEAGQRIDNFLLHKLKGVPKSLIYRIIRKGEVRINKKRIKPKFKLNIGDQLRIPPVLQNNNQHISPKLEKVAALKEAIIYEDNYILILNKPAGTPVHSGCKLSFGIIEGLRALWPNNYFLELIHRLDRNTSGILLVAKKRSVLRMMHEQLRMNSIKKYYLALVRGQWPSTTTVVDAPLMKTSVSSGKRLVQVNSNGKLSKTFFKVEERFTLATLVRASPVTGRTHQIRVHSQYAGHPIAFDNYYGDNIFDNKLKNSGLNRIFLHAVSLSFKHPASGKILHIEAPLDNSLLQCIRYLRTYHK